MHFVRVETFHDWRAEARRLLAADVPPKDVRWSSDDGQRGLFDDCSEPSGPPKQTVFSVPKQFLELAADVACH